MRDWNQSTLKLLLYSWSLFWSYLWGIEIHKTFPFLINLICFDLTYEGLKFSKLTSTFFRLKSFWSYLWGIEIKWIGLGYARFQSFDLTYEGLKLHNSYIWFIISPYRFDLTYEGLKFSFLYSNPFSIRYVLILPMRDWNIVKTTNTLNHALSFDLTYEGLKCWKAGMNEHLFLAFWSYLWGIEIETAPLWLSYESCFDLTYEGLKSLNLFTFVSSLTAFWSYLWGIEI